MKTAKQGGEEVTAKREKFLKIFKSFLVITLGCIIYALGVALLLDQHKIAPGGVTGIAIIINEILPIETDITGILIIAINVPLFILGAIFFGKKFTIYTVYATVVSSLFIQLWDLVITDLSLLNTNGLLIPALIGGAMFGIGLGLIFRMDSSTGGTDIIVKILRKKFRYVKTGVISLIIDIVIMGAAFAVFQDFELACYTLIAIVVFTIFFDLVLYGGNSARLVYVITTNEFSVAICDRILKELDIGATYVDGEGAYTGEQRRIIMCAVKNFLYPKIRDIVKDVDPHAFMIVSSAKEIYGEGYKDHFDEEL
ncbi:MAG: YitT family protein [Clostridia bacterium]|nr:YitT family protein [Clostridia bacterium]